MKVSFCPHFDGGGGGRGEGGGSGGVCAVGHLERDLLSFFHKTVAYRKLVWKKTVREKCENKNRPGRQICNLQVNPLLLAAA